MLHTYLRLHVALREGQTGEAWEPSTECNIVGSLDRGEGGIGHESVTI